MSAAIMDVNCRIWNLAFTCSLLLFGHIVLGLESISDVTKAEDITVIKYPNTSSSDLIRELSPAELSYRLNNVAQNIEAYLNLAIRKGDRKVLKKTEKQIRKVLNKIKRLPGQIKSVKKQVLILMSLLEKIAMAKQTPTVFMNETKKFIKAVARGPNEYAYKTTTIQKQIEVVENIQRAVKTYLSLYKNESRTESIGEVVEKPDNVVQVSMKTIKLLKTLAKNYMVLKRILEKIRFPADICGMGGGKCSSDGADGGCCSNKMLSCDFTNKCCIEREGTCLADADYCCRGLKCIYGKCQHYHPTPCPKPRDVVIAIDTSCSMSQSDKEAIRTFLLELVRDLTLEDGVHIAILTFNKGIQHVAYLFNSYDPDNLVQLIHNMDLKEEECATHTFAALAAIENEYFSPIRGDRPDVANVAIVITDGVTNPIKKQALTFQNADSLRATGVELIVIGLPQVCAGKDAPRCVPRVIGQEEWMGISGADEDPMLLLNILNTHFSKLRESLVNVYNRICH
ncbi:unnamed protein product [Owenia fusiformis]|uniref:Uncharacterized protein n=1 Tax=Owenia fusiformis TaxID=6347 RepID=A0A8J1TDE0_OWEFU|nr:unnamed protein product [Owenia fusiformis]